MGRFLTVPTVILTVVFLVAACTGSDDTVDELETTTSTAVPAVTVATPATTAATSTTTMAPPTTVETTTTSVIYVDLNSLDQLLGVWHDVTPGHGVYLKFDDEGVWGVYLASDVESATPYAWGTYTLDQAQITMIDDLETTICPGAVGILNVAVSADGEDVYFTFVEDSCTQSIRGEDWTLRRHAS